MPNDSNQHSKIHNSKDSSYSQNNIVFHKTNISNSKNSSTFQNMTSSSQNKKRITPTNSTPPASTTFSQVKTTATIEQKKSHFPYNKAHGQHRRSSSESLIITREKVNKNKTVNYKNHIHKSHYRNSRTVVQLKSKIDSAANGSRQYYQEQNSGRQVSTPQRDASSTYEWYNAITFPSCCTMNSNETVFLTKSGEILVSRCRGANFSCSISHSLESNLSAADEYCVVSNDCIDDCGEKKLDSREEHVQHKRSTSHGEKCCETAANIAVATVEAFSTFGINREKREVAASENNENSKMRIVDKYAVREDYIQLSEIELSKIREIDANTTPVSASKDSTEYEKQQSQTLDEDEMSTKGMSECKSESKEEVSDQEIKNGPTLAGDILVHMAMQDIPLPSFDYSGYSALNEVSRSFSNQRRRRSSIQIQQFPDMEIVTHGIPRFLSAISQVRITKVSANPLGGHVLLISKDGLLFSYGRNDHGQLGNGTQSLSYQMMPTIVTPLLENGGKAIECAAGVTHSLVVLKIDGMRVGNKLNSNSSDSDHSSSPGSEVNLAKPEKIVRVFSAPGTGEVSRQRLSVHPSSGTMCHHQIYSFGQNDYMKLGLLNPIEDEIDVLLPRRVAMHCKVWMESEEMSTISEAGLAKLASENNNNIVPPLGIFKIAASLHHSAALVRRASNVIEAFTWGKADDGALGITLHNPGTKFVSTPTKVESLSSSRYSRYDQFTQSSSSRSFHNHYNMLHASSLPLNFSDASLANDDCGPSDYPIDISLGPSCSLVLTALGRCLSFGKSDDGILGLGQGVVHVSTPRQINFSYVNHNMEEEEQSIVSISVGTHHAACVTRSGRVFTWGVVANGRLGISSLHSRLVSSSESNTLFKGIVWTPHLVPLADLIGNDTSSDIQIPFNEIDTPRPSNGIINHIDPESEESQNDSTLAVRVCAGLDSTMFLMRSGMVLSCGKESGRLGQGCIPYDVHSPKPLFGGLKLWQRQDFITYH